MDRQALASASSSLLGVDCLEPQMLTSGGGGLSWVRMYLPAQLGVARPQRRRRI